MDELERMRMVTFNTDDAPAAVVLRALQLCSYCWQPFARIIGDIRAVDISRACDEALKKIEIADGYRRAEESQAEEDAS